MRQSLSSLQHHAVLFDLDGTLIDSFPGIVSAYHHVLTQLDLGELNDSELAQFIGPPIREVLQQNFHLTGSRLEEGICIFRHHYGSQGLFRYTKYAGIDAMLHALHDSQYLLFIATSKLRSMALDLLDHAEWSDLFTYIGGADASGDIYLKQDVIGLVLSNVPAKARALAMVGDRAADISGAHSLGLPGIGVTWGYGSVMELTGARPKEIVHSPQELLTSLVKLD
jgi:phosphoglycolate phosphatase